MSGLRAITVCVDYADLLALTLPYNHHHFSEVWVVTSPEDRKTFNLVGGLRGERSKLNVFGSDAFHRNGAKFNKWLALEEGLDAMGREGWLCLMDADVLLPKSLEIRVEYETVKLWTPTSPTFYLDRGQLCTPLRRMHPTIPTLPPEESTWRKYPLHPNTREWAGYCQIFHASDPVLGPAPWHQTDWTHAGGADSFFQAKWPQDRKVRPPFEVLHLGEPGANWCGRASKYADGSEPDGGAERRAELQRLMRERRVRKGFQHERLPQPPA